MELREAIEHARTVAEGCPAGDRDCAYQNDKLADWLEELEKLREILGEDYSLERLKKVVDADRDGRYVVLPCKTVFVPTWDAGPNCDGNCPKGFYDEEPCDKCSRGKLFVYERPCRQEHIPLLGKTVFATREAALAKRETK